ncbi:hypothetical protein, partial [Burkholderia pseudomallei]|uniref:hypothetical protein n=1 Tax=Burkholderia pseudomallei TaxID=28450 RepID=UPI001CA48E66
MREVARFDESRVTRGTLASDHRWQLVAAGCDAGGGQARRVRGHAELARCGLDRVPVGVALLRVAGRRFGAIWFKP